MTAASDTLHKLHETRRSLAFDCSKHAAKSERAKANPFFVQRVYCLVINGVCDSYEEVISHADR